MQLIESPTRITAESNTLKELRDCILRIIYVWSSFCSIRVRVILQILPILLQNYYFCLTISSYHVTYAFQSESTLYSSLNIKEPLTRNRREIWTLCDWNGARTHNRLVRKRTLNHLAKLALQSLFFLYFEFWCHLNKTSWHLYKSLLK